MAISLKKGEKINLTKDVGLNSVKVGAGWDVNRYDGSKAFDIDLVIFECDENRKCLDDKHIIFYHNLTDPENAVTHTGDNRTGEGEGDDESATIDFSKVSDKVKYIVIAATIYDAVANSQNFGQIENAFIRAVNPTTNQEEARYDLSEDFGINTSIILAEVYKNDSGEWQFKAKGEGFNKELVDLCKEYGVDVA